MDTDVKSFVWGNQSPSPTQAQPKKKGPGGIKGFLINSLPAITSGIGAVGGTFLAPGAGTAAGGAAGGAAGEILKRKLLGEKQDVGQTAIQGLEGGVLSGLGSAAKGIKAAATARTEIGAGKTITDAAATNKSVLDKFSKNAVTQGQQMQGRVNGTAAGTKVAGKELTPQDTERMHSVLENEGISTGNSNNTLRDVTDKLKGYGQQISDHFKANDSPLHPEDTKTIASNYLNNIKTTDPSVLKQADIIANDLQKNVKSTKDLWEFRKSLDSRIPDNKITTDVVSSKIAAVKSAREYIANELGSIPGAKEYHSLSEIKPFVSAEAKRLNNPGGGVVGHVMASGPAQKLESLAGKMIEKGGKLASKESPQAVDTMSADALASSPSFMQKLVGAAANPIANPGQTAGAVFKQEAGRGFGIPAASSQATPIDQSQASVQPDVAGTITQTSTNNPTPSNNPFDPSNVEANVQAILQQGGKQKDVAEYLSNVKGYQSLLGSGAEKPLSSTAAQAIAGANAGLQGIDLLLSEVQKNPNVQKETALPGRGILGNLGNNVLGTANYQTALGNILDSWARVKTGAAISNTEEGRFNANLPQPFDSPDTTAHKLSIIKDLFTTVANRTSGNNSSDLLQEAAQAAQ